MDHGSKYCRRKAGPWRTGSLSGALQAFRRLFHLPGLASPVVRRHLPAEPCGWCILVCNAMIFSKDYVGYLARQTVKQLIDAKMIETTKPVVLNERVTASMLDELSLEDRINDEVRVILEAFQEDMRKSGASYPEMFKKVKNELARKYKAVL
jgi:hypothetical protein